MNYYLDFEFITGKIPYKLCGINFKNNNISTQPISIGLVCEDGRNYYAIFNDFNLDYAWNEFEFKKITSFVKDGCIERTTNKKNYWIRDNVLKPIYDELFIKVVSDDNMLTGDEYVYFNYSNLKTLIKKYGKYKEQIAEEIKEFCKPSNGFIREMYENDNGYYRKAKDIKKYEKGFTDKIESYKTSTFYGYYNAFDWYLFCNLFGGMLNLPKGFSHICFDLKQELYSKVDSISNQQLDAICSAGMYNHPKEIYVRELPLSYKLNHIKNYHKDYPKENNIHHALKDAQRNLELHKFIKGL